MKYVLLIALLLAGAVGCDKKIKEARLAAPSDVDATVCAAA